MKKKLFLFTIVIICLISNILLSQVRSFPDFSINNKWYYSYSVDITNSFVFNNYNEVWEYLKDTVISNLIDTITYKKFKGTTYDLNRKVITNDYFLFNIRNSVLIGDCYFDSTLVAGNYRLNTIEVLTVSIDSLFGANRLVCTLKRDQSYSSTGAHQTWLDNIRTIAGIGIEYLKNNHSWSGQGSQPRHEIRVRILKGAVLNGVLFGDTTFNVTDIKENKSHQVLSNISIENYPNPFNSNCLIKYTLPESGNIKLRILNIIGQDVYQPITEYKEKGVHEMNLNAINLSSGVYIIFIRLGNYTSVKKISLLK